MKGFHVSEVAKIPWGAPPGIPEIFVDEARDSRWTAEPPRQERASIGLRLAPDGAFGLLAADPLTGSGLPPQVLRLTPTGSLSRRELAPPASHFLQWQIVDFALDRNAGVYLLEQIAAHGGGATTLRKIGADGVEVWRRSEHSWQVEPDLEVPAGSFTGLLTGSSGVYISARDRGLIARIDPASGKLTRYADLPPWTGDALVGPDERVYYVRFAPERNARAWVCLDPETSRETETLCSPAAFDLLALPIGVDARGRAYGVHGWTVGCIEPQGSLLWRESLDGGSAAVRKATGEDRDLRLGSATSWRVSRDGVIYLSAAGASGCHLLALEPG
ncbi:MAG TPA: hypothetical protein VLQ45_15055 [Thermoanaerobaculia bacterium]|nr:hypothetical protein [Thermoanaerobaculia bacterium]